MTTTLGFHVMNPLWTLAGTGYLSTGGKGMVSVLLQVLVKNTVVNSKMPETTREFGF
jgi:hypothetical protein